MQAQSPGSDAHTMRAWLELRYRALKQEMHGIERLLGMETEETRLRAENDKLRARLSGRKRNGSS